MKYKTATAWYSSPEHFRSEKSWEEYKEAEARKRTRAKRKTQSFMPSLRLPSFRI